MTIKGIIGLVVYGIICFVASIVFARCSEQSAQKQIQEALVRAEAAEATAEILKQENTQLKDTMIRANDAVERALSLILEAQDKHEERIDIVEHDPDSADWLQCDLPDGVREAFADYYRHGANNTP